MKKATTLILLSTILIMSLTVSTVLSIPLMEQTQQKDQDCDKTCYFEPCEPIDHSYGYQYEHLAPGPHNSN